MANIIDANSIQLDKQPAQVVSAGSIELDKNPIVRDPSKPEPMPFDFDKVLNVLDIPIEALESTKRGFATMMKPLVQPFENVGYSAAASLNRGTANFATHLDHIANYIEKKTGLKKSGTFDDWAKKYNENADYWQKQAHENGATFLQEFFGEITGGAVPGIAEFILNVPYAAALGAAEADEKKRGEVAGAIIEGAKRGTLGAVFHAMGPFKQYLRAPMMGGVFGLQTATEGGNAVDIAKSAATGAIYSMTSPGGKIGLNEIRRNLESQTVKDMAAEPAPEQPKAPEAATAMKKEEADTQAKQQGEGNQAGASSGGINNPYPGYREVQKDEILQPGAEVKMDMATGKSYVKESSQPNGSASFAPEANFRRQPEQAKKTDEITRRSDLVRFLNEKLDIPIRTGRFRDKALGIFKLRPEVIRTEKANDIEVIAHEIGHAIQKFLYPEDMTQAGLSSRPFGAFKDELDPMATKPKEGQSVTPEGFAEFIRLYVTDQQMARDKAPLFYEHFEKELQNKSPETREILLQARNHYERWLKQPELQRVLSQVSVGSKDKREVSFDKLYTATVDDLFPLKNVVDVMAKGKDLKPSDDPYILARLLRGYTGKADAFIDHSPFKFKTYEDVGKSLKDILKPVRNDLDAFRGYVVSRRTIDLDKRKIETGVLPADARKVINDYDEKFGKAFDELKEYQDHTLQYLRDSGVMDKKTYDQIKQMNEDYVPLYRIMDEKPGKGGVGVGMIARNPVKKITGSWRDIQDPLESIIKNTYLYINAAEKNAVGQALVKLAEKTEGMGKYVEKIPTPMQEIKIKPDELQKLGIDDVPDNVVSIFRPQSFMPKDNVISVWEKGERKLYEVHPDVAKTFMALDKENLNLLMRVLSKPAAWLRAGATLTPEFIARNPLRDQFSAFVYSKYGFIPGVDLAQGIFSLAKKDQMYWDWKKGGGDHSMLVSMDRDYLQDKLGQTLTKYPVLNRIKNPIELLRIASELGEEGTRIGEFRKGIKAEGETKEGIQAAAFAARDVALDFSRAGNIGKSVNIITAFWNAQVQGIDKTVREFKEHPARTMAKVAASITLPSVLLAIATHDDERIKEVPAWERDLFWIIPTENNLWRIPKPFELGVIFGSVPERITHYILSQDPHAFDDVFKTVVNGLTPGVVPTAAIPIMENWANKSTFFDRPIVPTGRTELLPEYQYGPYTTETAKELGKILGKLPWEIEQSSPARIENLVRGWTGGLGMYALNIADQALLKSGIVERDYEMPTASLSEIPFIRAFHVRYPSANAESVKRFYDNYEKSNQLIKTAKVLMEKENKPEDAMRLMEMNSVNLQNCFEAVNNIRSMINMIYINPGMTGDEKREMIDILYMQMIDVAKMGNQIYDEMRGLK